MTAVTIRELRNHDGKVVDRVLAGEHLIVTRDRHAVAELRPESVSSSRIEGTEVTHRRLAEAIHDAGTAKHLAREIVGNIEARQAAIDFGSAADPFASDNVLHLHRLLMARTIRIAEGEYREKQNWIGAENIERRARCDCPFPST